MIRRNFRRGSHPNQGSLLDALDKGFVGVLPFRMPQPKNVGKYPHLNFQVPTSYFGSALESDERDAIKIRGVIDGIVVFADKETMKKHTDARLSRVEAIIKSLIKNRGKMVASRVIAEAVRRPNPGYLRHSQPNYSFEKRTLGRIYNRFPELKSLGEESVKSYLEN